MSIENNDRNPLFDNYPQDVNYIPCNRPRPPRKFELVIMTGETSIHSFEIPFNVRDWCSEIKVIYKYKLDETLIKTKNDEVDELDIVDDDLFPHCSIVSCTLEPEETNLFKDTLLDTQVQLRFVMRAPVEDPLALEIFDKKFHDSDIVFSDIYNVKVIDSLED